MLSKALAAAAKATQPAYVEDVFQTWLYTGNGSTQTITNGVDLAGKGGLVWLKERSVGTNGHLLFDTARVSGSNEAFLQSDTTGAEISGNYLTYNSNGFSLLTASPGINVNSVTYASWTFRKQAKFFDVVTYTGNGAESRNISHSLGATPGCIIIKCLSSSAGWAVWHRNNGTAPLNLGLNATWGYGANIYSGFPQSATSSTFNVDNVSNDINSVSYHCNLNNETYVAYLFAHDAGGFGDTGNDSVIKCGSFTTDGSGNATVNLGWEPQWLLWKASSASQNWYVHDNMRGLGTFVASTLYPNLANAEANYNAININSTGFTCSDNANRTYVYIAIRRGPMKTPTDATKVFDDIAYTGNGSTRTQSVGWPIDLSINMARPGIGDSPTWNDRLRGTGVDLYSNYISSESANGSAGVQFDNQTNLIVPSYRITNGTNYIDWVFRRAPGFFDVVAYTGTGSPRTVNHNLGVTPELIIVKARDTSNSWYVYPGPLSFAFAYSLTLNDTSSVYAGAPYWSNTAATASAFTVNNLGVNESGFKYISYLFASCPGVSKVGSYTGTGTTKQIDCGFTNSARFVLIKRTDNSGDWYVWDSARGIVAGNDPYLLLNSSAAEVTGTDYIDTYSAGFEISSTAPAAINANGGSFIFLAVA